MVSAFSRWRRYDETRQALAKVMTTVSALWRTIVLGMWGAGSWVIWLM
jgi:hypothetical protein